MLYWFSNYNYYKIINFGIRNNIDSKKSLVKSEKELVKEGTLSGEEGTEYEEGEG